MFLLCFILPLCALSILPKLISFLALFFCFKISVIKTKYKEFFLSPEKTSYHPKL